MLFGLLLISGALPQAIVLIAGIPFNATLFFFGETELVGHLPIYGAMLLLLVWGSDPRLRPLVSAFPWQWRERSSGAMSGRVLVAGSGIAGVEAVLGLRELAPGAEVARRLARARAAPPDAERRRRRRWAA